MLAKPLNQTQYGSILAHPSNQIFVIVLIYSIQIKAFLLVVGQMLKHIQKPKYTCMYVSNYDVPMIRFIIFL